MLFPYTVILLLVIIAEALFRKGNYLTNLAITLAGVLYVALPLALLNMLLFPFHLEAQYTPHIAAGYFFILWAFDTGAYVTGKPLGKHKMVPGISPAKSWEGFAGGIIIAALVSYIIVVYYSELTWGDWYVMLFIIIIMGTVGDLFESVLKRNAGVKDSGTIMPGHGGVLDRFDSVFLSLPVFVIYYLIKYKLLCC
jgi:phosphatidate cytidylyltransferase